MPYINVKVAGELTMEQKRVIADEVSETMLKVKDFLLDFGHLFRKEQTKVCTPKVRCQPFTV